MYEVDNETVRNEIGGSNGQKEPQRLLSVFVDDDVQNFG